jgi:hypothetical protein
VTSLPSSVGVGHPLSLSGSGFRGYKNADAAGGWVQHFCHERTLGSDSPPGLWVVAVGTAGGL